MELDLATPTLIKLRHCDNHIFPSCWTLSAYYIILC